jgi:type II secretory pathway pseudopilin PulG
MVELMIVVAIIGILTPALLLLFVQMSQGMAADEMRIQLATLNQNTMLRFHERLGLSRHLMLQDGNGQAFLALRSTSASAPPTMAGSLLPKVQTNANNSFAPGQAAASLFGNSLFFGAYDMGQTIKNIKYSAPLTISSASATFSSNGPATVILDVYRFWYYYLTLRNDMALRDIGSYRLVEWQSVPFVDGGELDSISGTDNTLLTNIIKYITVPANVGGVTYTMAWDPTQATTANAFYDITTSGGFNQDAAPAIAEASWTYLTHVNSGILSNGFKYGICGNDAGWKNAPPNPVPEFGGPASPTFVNPNTACFPGGFEVGVSGQSNGREVLIRCLLVAQGATPRVVYNDLTNIVNPFDVW